MLGKIDLALDMDTNIVNIRISENDDAYLY